MKPNAKVANGYPKMEYSQNEFVKDTKSIGKNETGNAYLRACKNVQLSQ